MSDKALSDYFRDWESEVFGYGYGTGEPFVVNALLTFFEHTKPEFGQYHHADIENAIGAPAAWLLINTLCHARVIDYGTSPRIGWLTENGQNLKDFALDVGRHGLLRILDYDSSSNMTICTSGFCNCDSLCANPFINPSPSRWHRGADE